MMDECSSWWVIVLPSTAVIGLMGLCIFVHGWYVCVLCMLARAHVFVRVVRMASINV